MLVSHRKQFIFLKTFKTAGTSIESYFEPFCMPEGDWTQLHIRPEHVSEAGIIGYRGYNPEGKTYFNHISAEKLKSLVGDDIWTSYFKFTVIRNPFDKQVSAYYFQKRHNPNAYNDGRSDIEHFRDWLKRSWEKVYDGDKYLLDGKICVDDFIRFEQLEQDIKRVGDRLGIAFQPERLPRFKSEFRQTDIPVNEFYDSECEKIIRNKYKLEFELFGY